MVGGVNVRPPNGTDGASPSGKTKSPPGSKDTTARTFGLLILVRHPSVPLCECVTRMPGPIFSNSAATAFVFTSTSYGPVFGTDCRKNCSSAEGSRENWTPG